MNEASTHGVTIYDIDQLVTGATPQFSQQILERVKALIAPLPEGNEVRTYGELQLEVLDRMARATTRGIRAPGVPGEGDGGWASIPSHPSGGIAPGATDGGH
ncbi:MAG: hypothetical protein JWM86_1892 [Thermoleophilia bacterium]|nr:hypothetical protein [Thermoleophilia bacterium]